MKKNLRITTFGLALTFMFSTLGFAQNQIQLSESSKDDAKLGFETVFEAFTGTDDADTDWTVWPVNNWTYNENHLRMENPASNQTNSNAFSQTLIDASDYENLELEFTLTLEDEDFVVGYGLNVILKVLGEEDQNVYQQVIDESFYNDYFYLGSFTTQETIDISEIAGGKEFRIEFVFGGYTGDIEYWETTNLKVLGEVETFALNLNAVPEEGGTVTGAGSYQLGESVLVTASANEGYSFVNWTDGDGNEVVGDAELYYTMPAADMTLTANFDDGTGVESITQEQINIYPNPADRQFNIESDVMIEKVLVLDKLGKTVHNTSINAKEASIQAHEFETGIYFLQIFTAEGAFVKKLLVK